jgi:hypothetical protein
MPKFVIKTKTTARGMFIVNADSSASAQREAEERLRTRELWDRGIITFTVMEVTDKSSKVRVVR